MDLGFTSVRYANCSVVQGGATEVLLYFHRSASSQVNIGFPCSCHVELATARMSHDRPGIESFVNNKGNNDIKRKNDHVLSCGEKDMETLAVRSPR